GPPIGRVGADGRDAAQAVVPLGEGGCALVAREDQSTPPRGLTRLIRYGADRSVCWQLRLPGAGRGEPAGLIRLPGDDLAVVGHQTADAREATQLWVARVSTGEVVTWERRLGPDDEERRGGGGGAPGAGGGGGRGRGAR